jgi:hypothetical protein
MKINNIQVQHVQCIPKELKPGILYVSEEFGTAAHLCACGCGSKVRTPLGETDWKLEEGPQGPTLRPSVGNWQIACQSHYWIFQGEILWAESWTPEQIADGRRAEQERARVYYDKINQSSPGIWVRIWSWIVGLFK